MAHVSEIRSNAISYGSSQIIARLVELRDTLSTRFTQYRAYRTTLNELRNLSQRELDDMGIHAENIREIALTAAKN